MGNNSSTKTFRKHVINGHNDVIRHMLAEGGFPREKLDAPLNRKGDTALHLTLRHGRYTLVPLLLNYGCQVNRRNHEGQTALDVYLSRELPGDEDILHHHFCPYSHCEGDGFVFKDSLRVLLEAGARGAGMQRLVLHVMKNACIVRRVIQCTRGLGRGGPGAGVVVRKGTRGLGRDGPGSGVVGEGTRGLGRGVPGAGSVVRGEHGEGRDVMDGDRRARSRTDMMDGTYGGDNNGGDCEGGGDQGDISGLLLQVCVWFDQSENLLLLLRKGVDPWLFWRTQFGPVFVPPPRGGAGEEAGRFTTRTGEGAEYSPPTSLPDTQAVQSLKFSFLQDWRADWRDGENPGAQYRAGLHLTPGAAVTLSRAASSYPFLSRIMQDVLAYLPPSCHGPDLKASPLVPTLTLAGYKFTPEERQHLQLKFGIDFKAYDTYRRRPVTLKHASRLAIRFSLRTNVIHGVGELPCLPPSLKLYLTLDTEYGIEQPVRSS